MSLEIQNLHVRHEILHGVDLVIDKGQTHALMGPNGSGKSTLANTLMGNPVYEITEGRIVLDGEDITEADPDVRAKAGMFMAFQYPVSIPGVSVANFLRTAMNATRGEPIKVKEFGDVTSGRNTLGAAAQSELNEIRNLGIGKPAPEIKGEDIDGTPFKLSDYKGKVVVVDFWGDW